MDASFFSAISSFSFSWAQRKENHPQLQSIDEPLVGFCGFARSSLYRRRDAIKPFLHQDSCLACMRSRKPGNWNSFLGMIWLKHFKNWEPLIRSWPTTVLMPDTTTTALAILNKKDCSVRLIRNLKKLNSFVENSLFTMESIHTVFNLVTPSCWMAKWIKGESF